MSNTIIEKSTGKEIGPDKELRLREAAKPGYVPPPSKESYFRQLELVPVKIESLINRDTLDSNISKILKNGGGFKSDKWDPPTVGRLPDGTMILYDGDHSRHIFQLAYPDEDMMLARVVDVENKGEIHRRFVEKNKLCRTDLRREEVFVHEVLSGARAKIKLAQQIGQMGLSVYCSGEQNGSVGDPDGPRVKVGSAETVMSILGDENVSLGKEAVGMLRSTGQLEKPEDSAFPLYCLVYAIYDPHTSR